MATPPKTKPQAVSREPVTLEDLAPLERSDAFPLSDEEQRALTVTTLGHIGPESRLPAFPAVAMQVVELANRSGASANELVRLINQDPTLTAQLLRVANSVYSSRGIEITGARDAVTRLGFKEVAALAATAATKALFQEELRAAGPAVLQEQSRLWIIALTSGLGASWLAMETRGDSQKAFLGGMLHDIGKTLALRAYAELRAAGKLEAPEPERALPFLLEALHLELGTRVASEWKLPAHVARVCAEHHEPKATAREDRELHLVRVVAAIAEMHHDPHWPPQRMTEVEQSAAELGFDKYRLRATSTQLKEIARKAQSLAKAAA